MDRRKIQCDAIKTVGEHEIKIRLHKEMIIDLTVTVTAAAVESLADAEAQILSEEPEPIGFGSMDEY